MGTSKIGKMYHKIVLAEEPTSFVTQLQHINFVLKDKDHKKILKEFGMKIKDYYDFVDQYENDDLDEIQLDVLETLGIKLIKEKVIENEVQHVNRVFASNDTSVTRTLYKYKWMNKKLSRSLIANLPKNVFIYNDEIKNFDLWHLIDLQWYIDEAKRKVEFYKSIE